MKLVSSVAFMLRSALSFMAACRLNIMDGTIIELEKSENLCRGFYGNTDRKITSG
jgi:hypothetical protein